MYLFAKYVGEFKICYVIPENVKLLISINNSKNREPHISTYLLYTIIS